jgi:acyl-CoA dehydrogenase
MEYDDSERAREMGERAREFFDDIVLPVEREHVGTGEQLSMDTIEDLREEARERDLFMPQIPEKYGGQGLSFSDMLPTFEQAGRSLIGSFVLKAGAPSEGNIRTFEKAGTDDQIERWLEPMLNGELRSAFSMTEPMQGGGSDPKMIKTTAEKDGDEWVIDGHKWWTTAGSHADFLLVMARSDQDAHPYEGCTNFIVPTDTEGVEIVRDIPTIGGDGITDISGGHAEIRYEGVRIPEDNVLGDVNGGFQLSQYRLGGGRLTHCMRYTGMAERALDVAKAYLVEREGFGESLSDKQALRHRIADAETELHMARTGIRHAAKQVAAGEEARIEIAMAKTYTANIVQDAVDLAVQCCGANGIGKDLPLAYFYESVRAFRIIDGADEVHRRSIARDAFEDPPMEELEYVTRFKE